MVFSCPGKKKLEGLRAHTSTYGDRGWWFVGGSGGLSLGCAHISKGVFSYIMIHTYIIR